MTTQTADAAIARRNQTPQTPQQRAVAGLRRLDTLAQRLHCLIGTVAAESVGVSVAIGQLMGNPGDAPTHQIDADDAGQVAALRGLLTTQARRYEALASLFDQGLTNVLNDLEVVWTRSDLVDGEPIRGHGAEVHAEVVLLRHERLARRLAPHLTDLHSALCFAYQVLREPAWCTPDSAHREEAITLARAALAAVGRGVALDAREARPLTGPGVQRPEHAEGGEA